jgi:hypothetical protein
MIYWYYFWMVDFAIAGCAFVAILLIVAVRGARDLRDMLADLRQDGRDR